MLSLLLSLLLFAIGFAIGFAIVTFRELGLVVVDDGGVLAAVFVCGVFNASELAASSIKMMIVIIYAIIMHVYRVGFGVALR